MKKDLKADQSAHVFAIQITSNLTECKFLKNEKQAHLIIRNKPLTQSEYTLPADCPRLTQFDSIPRNI